ncbi:DUF58 domain-containing protein [Agromyces protaetiae]|nr:DUF58 domain-containing protein [Agromyces protaetiae]
MSRATRRRAALPRFTRRGAALLICGVLLFSITPWFDLRDLMLLAFIGILLPVVALGYVFVRTPSLAVRRTFEPAVVGAGGSARVLLAVQNRGRRALDSADWRDTAPNRLQTPPEAILPALGPWERLMPRGDDTAKLEYRLRVPYRGVFEIGPLKVTTTDPFGLASIVREVGTAHELVVTPTVTALDPALGTAAAVDGVLHGVQRRTHPNADEFIAREYRHGDPMRRVHWPATARRGELMVRDEEQRGDPEARLVVDTTLSGRAGRGAVRSEEDPRHAGFELAMEIAASVGTHLLERGFQVRVDRLADPVHQPLSEASPDGYRSPGGEHALLEDLARVENPLLDARHGASDDDPAAIPVSHDARMPGYAVLVDPDAAQVQLLVALRPALSPAVAFVVPGVSSRVVEALEDADWRIVPVRRAADLPEAWSIAGRTRQSAGGGSDAS